MKKGALISVTEKEGLEDLAKTLNNLGYTILSTLGTGKYLAQHGVQCQAIEEYTGQKEILDGRVKTLHPKIHAGTLARRDNPAHMQELADNDILPIDVLVVNLYPFIEMLKTEVADRPSEMVEFIDVGGPSMLRGAAKNFQGVYVVTERSDYARLIEVLKSDNADLQFAFRKELAAKAFTLLAHYNLEIARYFSTVEVNGLELQRSTTKWPEVNGQILIQTQELRYGENPHQAAALYSEYSQVKSSDCSWEQLHGKELSYNNLLDTDAALRMLRSFSNGACFAVIFKHLNPCGAAFGDNLLEALARAKLGDPRSHFGGIIGFTQAVTVDVAEAVREDFTEIVVAPDYTDEALALLRKNKNIRLIKANLKVAGPQTEFRSMESGVLAQQRDAHSSQASEAKVVSTRQASEQEMKDLQLAWTLCAHVKSNAIVFVRDGMLIATGAGQMSRIDSIELCISKAKTHAHDLAGAVCASDAFFPFTDAIETLAQNGISAVIVPGGAKRDDEVQAAANQHGISLLFATDRHFRH